MNSKEKAIEIYELCVARSEDKKTLTYGEVQGSLGYQKGVSGVAIRYGLELLLVACADKGSCSNSSHFMNKKA